MDDIEVQNISFAYGNSDTLVIKDLNIKIDEGDFVCILGKSGCGKSTLLRLIAGLEKPTEGKVLISGEEITGASMERSVVFQDYGLFPWMSAGDNLMLALTQKYPKRSKKELKPIVMENLRKVGLQEDVYKKYPRELSGGMKQRCAIARSLCIDSTLLLMDEPFGALDAVTRAMLQELILDLWEQDEPKRTVVFITHDVDEALLLATKIFVLGQSPSNVIFSCDISAEDRGDRDGIHENPKIIELRNELVHYINQDVAKRVAG